MNKKIILFLLIITNSFTLISCNQNSKSEGDDTLQDTDNKVEIIDDNHFKTGFHLLGISPVESKREIFRWLNYNNTAEETKEPVWYMAQWWTKYNFANSQEKYENDLYVYQNESRVVKVNPKTGYLYTELNAELEYDHPREQNESWPHILIEQNFADDVYLNNIEKIIAKVDVNILKVENKTGPKYNPDYHAAQLLWYFTIRNKPLDGSEEEVGVTGDYMWFGVPIYDSRYSVIKEHSSIDSGFDGATGKLIYSMSNGVYLPTPIDLEKTYYIEVDILPYIRKAYNYAQQNGALKNVKFENLVFDNMNFGWELPGTFNVASEIQNMSVEVYYK